MCNTSIFAQVCLRRKKNIVVNSENKALSTVDNAVGHFANTCFKVDSFKVSRYVDALLLVTSIKSYLLSQTNEPEANMTFKSKVTNKMGESSVVVIQEYTSTSCYTKASFHKRYEREEVSWQPHIYTYRLLSIKPSTFTNKSSVLSL